jgi:hypothetical protein
VRDSESLLRRELEARGGKVKQLDTNQVLLEVPTGGGRFTKDSTNLLVSCTPLAQMPYLVMVDQDLGYRGADPFLHGVFGSRARLRGWRPLLLAPEHFTQSDRRRGPGNAHAARASDQQSRSASAGTAR